MHIPECCKNPPRGGRNNISLLLIRPQQLTEVGFHQSSTWEAVYLLGSLIEYGGGVAYRRMADLNTVLLERFQPVVMMSSLYIAS